MNKLTALTGVSAFVLLLATLSGCSSTKSPGEVMMTQGQGTADLGKQWTDGERLVKKGEKLIDKGKDKVSDGKDMIDDGEDMVKQGKNMMRESEESYRKRGKIQIE